MNNNLSLYYPFRDQFQNADLTFWQGHDPLPELIKIKTGGYSHVALVIRLDEFKGMTDRVWVMGALESGFELRLLSEELLKYNGNVFGAPLKEGHDREKPTIWAMQHDAVPYDKWGLVKQLWERTPINDKIFFCSGGVYLAYRAGNIIPEQKFAPWPGECSEWDCLVKPFVKIL